jgi:hypothetical protein
MIGIIAAALIVCWLLGILAFHISMGLFHLVLVLGVILLLVHFLRGRGVTA